MADQTQIPPTAPTQGGGYVATPGEQQAVPTSGTPSPQADQNNPQTPDSTVTGTGKDDGGAADSGAPDQPQNPQAPQGAQGAPQGKDDTQGQDNGPFGATGHPSPGNQPSNPNLPPPAEVHPAVQKANLIHDIAQTLSGGPRTSYAIDPNTGEMKATSVPLTNSQIGQAIALAALSGGIAGLGERGPGATGRAAQDGFAQVAGQQEKIKQQQQQEASQNYARQAAITQTNFQTHQNALRLSQMELDYHKQFVDTAAPILKNLGAVGAAQASGVTESDLVSKYHVTKDMAIPDGTVENGKNPDGSAHFENTYTVIDPQKKIELPEETAKLLADMRVPGYYSMKDGKAVPTNFAGSAGVKAGLVVNGLALAQGIQITEAQMNQQLNKYGGEGAAGQFDVNLKKAIADGTLDQKKLQVLSAYSNMAPDLAVAAMEKNKVDPATVQAYQRLVPQEVIDNSKMARESAEAHRKAVDAAKNLVITPKNAEEVLGDKSGLYTPEQKATAQQVQKMADAHEIHLKATEAGANESARLNTEIKIKKANGIPLFSGQSNSATDNDPAFAAAIKPGNVGADGINRPALDALYKSNPQRAALVEAIIHGQRLESLYGLAKKDGQALAEDAQAIDPSFDFNKVQSWHNFVAKEMTPGGKVGSRVIAANTALNHLDALVHNVGWMNSMAQGVKGADMVHIPGYAAVKADKEGLSSEIAKYYKGASPDKEAVENLNKVLSGNPENVKEGAKELAKLLHGGIDTLHTQAESMRPSQHVGMPAFVTPMGARSYKSVTGEDVDPSFLGQKGTTPTQGGSQQAKPQIPQNAPVPKPGEKPVWHNGSFLGFTADGKTLSTAYSAQ